MIGEEVVENAAPAAQEPVLEEEASEQNGPQVPELIEQLNSQQYQMMAELRSNQRQMQRKLEDSLCKGLEGITKIRFGAQAKEFFEDTQKEREQMREEVVGLVRSAFTENNDNVLRTITEQNRLQEQQLVKENLEQRNMILSEVTDLTGNLHEKFVSTLEQSQEKMVNVMTGTIENFTSSLDRLATLVSESQDHLARTLTTAMENMGTMVTGAVRELQSKRDDSYHPQLAFDFQARASSTPDDNLRSQGPKIKSKKSKRKSCDSSSDESDHSKKYDSDSDDETLVSHHVRSSTASFKKSNIPPFTGKETWQVWVTRFEEIAKRQGWTDEEKLDILLPKLQGEAGSFVYEQLSSKMRNSYKTLIKELKNRFRKVENPKTYGALFASRKQKATESVELYAAELKKLYDKAHARRDFKTREEDLLRRFLDGLQDTKASFHVEFVKNPVNIDEAVDEVINFQEVRRKQGKSTRQVNCEAPEVQDSSSDDEMSAQVARAPGRPPKVQKPENQVETETKDSKMEETINLMAKQLDELKKDTKESKELHQKQMEQTAKFPKTPRSQNFRYNEQGKAPQNQNNSNSGWVGANGQGSNRPPYVCFHCNEPGHFMRDCQLLLGQMNVNTGPQGKSWGRQDSGNGARRFAPANGSGNQ